MCGKAKLFFKSTKHFPGINASVGSFEKVVKIQIWIAAYTVFVGIMRERRKWETWSHGKLQIVSTDREWLRKHRSVRWLRFLCRLQNDSTMPTSKSFEYWGWGRIANDR